MGLETFTADLHASQVLLLKPKFNRNWVNLEGLPKEIQIHYRPIQTLGFRFLLDITTLLDRMIDMGEDEPNFHFGYLLLQEHPIQIARFIDFETTLDSMKQSWRIACYALKIPELRIKFFYTVYDLLTVLTKPMVMVLVYVLYLSSSPKEAFRFLVNSEKA